VKPTPEIVHFQSENTTSIFLSLYPITVKFDLKHWVEVKVTKKIFSSWGVESFISVCTGFKNLID